MRITVLLGGPSAEREISLISGKAVADALRKAGHDVFESDISPTNRAGLDRPCDVVFPVLHGAFGESGELQEILESRRMPFVGSSSRASHLGMDKVETKLIWEQNSLPTPPWHVAMPGAPGSVRGPNRISAPCVVKAINSGSSIDVYICKEEPQARDAIAKVLHAHGQALVEKLIVGTELTVGIFEERPLSPIRITTTREFFDFDAKYKGNSAKHDFELNLPGDVVKNVQELARRAHEAIGCRDLSRVDLMLDQNHQPYLLEINTMPGFTSKSLLPEAAAHDGIGFVELVDRLVKRAKERGAGPDMEVSAA
ncbi:MAG: D-alanine--D-alanine ligase [Anaerolineae bacterium]|nr:D-alanine--D-alanine ligase [Phycisphaerae bacterium]